MVGFRTWHLLIEDPHDPAKGGWLASNGMYGAQRWQPTMHATCKAERPHTAPASDCDCGLYAWHECPFTVGGAEMLNVTYARNMYGGIADARRRVTKGLAIPNVVGAIAAWGDVELYREGFRAEWASVIALAVNLPDAFAAFAAPGLDCVRATAARYGAEFVKLDELREAAERHGKPAPEELLPEPEPAGEVMHSMQQLHRAMALQSPVTPGGSTHWQGGRVARGGIVSQYRQTPPWAVRLPEPRRHWWHVFGGPTFWCIWGLGNLACFLIWGGLTNLGVAVLAVIVSCFLIFAS